MLCSHDDTASLEARQKVTLGLFTLSNLYAEELESKGWTTEDLAMATKDAVNLCLTNSQRPSEAKSTNVATHNIYIKNK